MVTYYDSVKYSVEVHSFLIEINEKTLFHGRIETWYNKDIFNKCILYISDNNDDECIFNFDNINDAKIYIDDVAKNGRIIFKNDEYK